MMRCCAKSVTIRCSGCWSSCPPCFVVAELKPEAHTLLFVLSVLAIVPLATLLSHATESVAAKTGDTVGGLLNATLGNLTELVIALAALRAGQYMLVKASIAGAIVTNSLFMLGASFLLGGLKYHVQEFNRVSARLQASLLFLATIALLIPSAVRSSRSRADGGVHAAAEPRSVWSCSSWPTDWDAVLAQDPSRIVRQCGARGMTRKHLAVGLALGTLAAVTVLVALVSEVFVESVQQAAAAFGMTPAFVGFIVVALVGGGGRNGLGIRRRPQEQARPERRHRPRQRVADRVVRGARAGAAQLRHRSRRRWTCRFWPGAVVMMLIATLTAALVTNSGRSTWFIGVLVLMVYLIFAMTLYLLPPRVSDDRSPCLLDNLPRRADDR